MRCQVALIENEKTIQELQDRIDQFEEDPERWRSHFICAPCTPCCCHTPAIPAPYPCHTPALPPIQNVPVQCGYAGPDGPWAVPAKLVEGWRLDQGHQDQEGLRSAETQQPA
jgi:hypothetical protein